MEGVPNKTETAKNFGSKHNLTLKDYFPGIDIWFISCNGNSDSLKGPKT